MILHCDFEELAALTAATNRALEAAGYPHALVAPPQAITDLQVLLPQLVGDIVIDTLAEQTSIRRGIALLTDELRARMNAVILEQHPAAEDAVLAYFDYARVLSVLARLDRIGHEMAAIIELMTGQPAGADSVQRFSFPDD